MYYIKGRGWFVVRDSARKHGISDGDMCHAIAHSIVVLVVDRGPRGRAIHLGASPPGRLLEVVTVDEGEGKLLIIHAMAMRPKFMRYLTRW